ncbi:hypothetical protein [Dermatobacter hominis]|uniref:hypothetical protein n=1 Tax=Dermatobacter hominis TaxID=2884263 RepID=UPI001D11FE86|nr:hypothetical protein [Dermatobacter hominis]UDY35655.1 hypothetical protein LH044_20290 [Dermatobacter hominis]
MRPAAIGVGLLLAAGAVVPIGCGDGSTSADEPATTLAHAEHAGAAPSETSTSSVPPAPSRLDIVATEYEWSGLPEELRAGSYPTSFRNDGVEAHEITIFRNPEHRSLEELYELGPMGIKDAVEVVGTLIAGPGAAADAELTLDLGPGEYEVVCFFPAKSDGKPHFGHGMHRTLTVR